MLIPVVARAAVATGQVTGRSCHYRHRTLRNGSLARLGECPAAGGKNLEVFPPTIGRQLLALGLIDEIDLHVVPVLLGQGIRLYDNPGGQPVRLDRVGTDDPAAAVNVRYRPAPAAQNAVA